MTLAILAFDGELPQVLRAAHPDAVVVTFAGSAHQMRPPTIEHRYEKLGSVFDDLRARGVTRLVLAGGLSRPPLDPAQLDPFMMALAPRIMAAMQGGDDALLRLVISVFEDQGFTVIGAHELCPELVAAAGLLAGPKPSQQDQSDATRAADILLALSPLDVGQGAVVAAGLCLGVETVQGTDFMLDSVARTAPHLRRAKGVQVKAAKRGQDLRVDMPAIGPDTIAGAVRAGLSGIVIQAGSVMILDRAATCQAAEDAGIFLMAQEL